MEGPQGVEIEINVRIKLLAIQVFVRAAPDVVAIINQSWDKHASGGTHGSASGDRTPHTSQRFGSHP
jgi:hypothetical protein